MRKCSVVSLCMPEVPDTVPEANMERAEKWIDTAAALSPDLICLPEVFTQISVPFAVDRVKNAEMCRARLSHKAKTLGCYIIAGLIEPINGSLYNTAWLIDRQGHIAGRYVKFYPTDYEMNAGILPGTEIPVFQTDFGTVGILICFDIDWPGIWTEMARKGAEMVVWISAYDGGYPLAAYAAINRYYVVSSVRSHHSRIIDPAGKEIAVSSKWANMTHAVIGMDQTWFHVDRQYDILPLMIKDLGNRVTVTTYDEENRFTLSSNDPEWPMERIIRTYGLVTFDDYHARIEAMQIKARGGAGRLI